MFPTHLVCKDYCIHIVDIVYIFHRIIRLFKLFKFSFIYVSILMSFVVLNWMNGLHIPEVEFIDIYSHLLLHHFVQKVVILFCKH